MTKQELIEQIRLKKSFLCVGLDSDISRIPEHLKSLPDPVFEFNKKIIDATKDLCVAYKPNIAFYESLGASGWESLQKTIEYIPKTHFTIADAKRGDIGNTSRLYAKTFFDTYDFDSVTVAPYMGKDSVHPFLQFDNKWVILLALTSNPSSHDFQFFKDGDLRLFEKVLQVSKEWGSDENLMYVVGATKPEYLKEIRTIIPDHFLLVPGVGAQGGSLEEVAEQGMNKDIGLLVNSSRGIIFADASIHFAEAARSAAESIQSTMEQLMS